ncbi:MAG: glycogen/starch/alpha-glucan phosphorylase [Candidatus Omnitrophica bacterium]|nr:glycogen/starch/alpha-glucan phosphorylase [Candidatus Omnitrophota bacterium]
MADADKKEKDSINQINGQKPQRAWITVHKKMTKEGIKTSFKGNLQYRLAKDKYTATKFDNFMAVAVTIRDRIVERWIKTQQQYHKKNVKRVYYLSMEFLIGRLLGSNILNLGLFNEMTSALEEMGFDIEELRDEELDAGLGNGGLGRLAACFLDSMATLGIPAHGYGIRYDYGIFNQKIVNGYQVELPDEWLRHGNPWEFARPEYTVKIRFGGKTRHFKDKRGKFRVRLIDSDDVLALPFDMPIVGYKNDVINTLRLWSARSTEDFDFSYFNDGDYESAVYNKMFSENISRVLYPNDTVSRGRELRLKQEYFFTAASIADIIRRFKVHNSDFKNFPDKVAIQLNDTHPSLATVELLRILIDEENLDWDAAWEIVTQTFAYTNHTILPEALEAWSLPLFQKLLPRHLELIYEINHRFLREVATMFPLDNDILKRVSIIEESNPQRIRMANLSIIASHSVNGVSALHSKIIRESIFKDFYVFWPEKFNNKTNGITQRRWLQKSNPHLSKLITDSIGDGWVTDLYQLKKLEEFSSQSAFLKKWQQVKVENKKNLAQYVYKNLGVKINPESMFDVQVKRIHEYKRQLLFAFYAISEYLKIKNDPNGFCVPRTFIFGGKAAPGYFMAKLIIKFVNNIAEVINKDRSIKGKLRVVFLENYRVSLAERIFPASDLSEQISTAGKEASGTGCMKFMINGALTVGTLDGANIEMKEAVGEENIYIFGLNIDQVNILLKQGYNPKEYVARSVILTEIVRLMKGNFFSPIDPGLFDPILETVLNKDPYFICADFDSYLSLQEVISKDYNDKSSWTKRSILNVASSGKFSSDRTISEYAGEIWKVPYNCR